MEHRVVPALGQRTDPQQVSPGLRQQLIDCWITVSNAGGAVGFPFLPVDSTHVAPVADELIASLEPGRSRLLVALTGPAQDGRAEDGRAEDGRAQTRPAQTNPAQDGAALAGWLHLARDPDQLVAHWGAISRLQTHPAFRGRGVGSALMAHAQQVARDEMGLEQLHLAVRGGTGLERFYARLGWTVIGRWPRALRLAPGDDRDEILMVLTPL